MASLISLYKERLNLPEAQFTFIDHEDAMVAAVFKISQSGKPRLDFESLLSKRRFFKSSVENIPPEIMDWMDDIVRRVLQAA